ncbi:hypothetical protein PoB_002981400 [Plakobranchus ocellatus]|uniref:Uncharacterized protein n=1 Tax=Plakobranchus ocellatus TaxID=259542 RepID=A0AAV4AA31_9GAST|nr:hypothetical protein PoB_002981400 [Plakobranchus ocellatus]
MSVCDNFFSSFPSLEPLWAPLWRLDFGFGAFANGIRTQFLPLSERDCNFAVKPTPAPPNVTGDPGTVKKIMLPWTHLLKQMLAYQRCYTSTTRGQKRQRKTKAMYVDSVRYWARKTVQKSSPP